ncbi:hypothetical protein E2C01_046263 [Portunus trituberculatus]|uniref:Uncharacterized protein n=1 Tax=Portunus trituberculatus TaxID=210409 RepID=A0A5B7G4R6_PORTR|nr:hypothetical protein [Portunus trituberculatus]
MPLASDWMFLLKNDEYRLEGLPKFSSVPSLYPNNSGPIPVVLSARQLTLRCLGGHNRCTAPHRSVLPHTSHGFHRLELVGPSSFGTVPHDADSYRCSRLHQDGAAEPSLPTPG